MQTPSPSKDKQQHAQADKFLRQTRTILISSAVDQKLAEKVIQQVFYLENLDEDKEIRVFINSPGGEIFSGMAIYDTLRFVSCPVTTVVIGLAASMGSVLALAGDEGKKFALPYARFMIHQPLLTGYVASATEVEIQAAEMNKTKKTIAELYAEKTKKKLELILKDIDRDHWFDAEEALDYGLIDKVLKDRKELPLFKK